jgi:hypothetical protein
MRVLTYSKILLVGASAVAISVAAVMTACSSSSTPAGGGPPGGGDSGNNNNPQSCTSMALNILFTPMYSASDGTHMFQLPAIVDGVDNTPIVWTVSDTTVATVAKDDTFVTGGAMITATNANGGTVTVTANLSGVCGTSTLTVTGASPNDWEIGNQRYNDGVSIHFGGRGGGDGGGGGMGDGGAMTDVDGGGPACTNCHGPTATMGAFNDISHTPAQTGGFSDDDLVNIIVNGIVPDGGYFDTTIISYQRWQQFHHWTDIGPDQQKGIIVYLRSLTPVPQAGSANFGGHFGDGGMHFGDGGFHRPDGSTGGNDAATDDAATGD